MNVLGSRCIYMYNIHDRTNIGIMCFTAVPGKAPKAYAAISADADGGTGVDRYKV